MPHDPEAPTTPFINRILRFVFDAELARIDGFILNRNWQTPADLEGLFGARNTAKKLRAEFLQAYDNDTKQRLGLTP